MAVLKRSSLTILLVINICTVCCIDSQDKADVNVAASVKKQLELQILPKEQPSASTSDKDSVPKTDVPKADERRTKPESNSLPSKPEINDQIHVEESNFKEKLFQPELEISDSLKSPFYFFIALSCGAILVFVVRMYRMRLSRAERKYGVQGNRTTQELTPLPTSIEAMEDGNSDEDDHTLFEINRQQIRIL